MLDWNDLRYFLSVANRGSASAAAVSMGVDKGTVSRRIAALEKASGVRLFDRKASGWSLTAAGRSALGPARQIEATVTLLQVDLGGTGPRARVPVRLSAPQWFCSELLLPRIGQFQKTSGWIDLNLSARSRVADLAEREVEIGLRNVRPDKGDFVVRKAGDLASAIYASRDLLDQRPPVVERKDVLGERLVGYPDKVTYVPGFDWLQAGAVGKVPALRVDDAFAITAALCAGAGMGVIPCFLGDRDNRLRRVTAEIHLEPIWLVAPRELARTLAVRRTFEFVASAFAQNRNALGGIQRPPDTSKVVPVT